MDGCIGVIFVCYGNICRSPLGEFILKDMVSKRGLDDRVRVASSGTNVYWEGDPVSRGSQQELRKRGISCDGKTSRQLRAEDLYDYDYVIAMDGSNLAAIMKMQVPEGCIVKLMMDFAGGGDVADPYYTHNYEKAYEDIERGCAGLMREIEGRLGS